MRMIRAGSRLAGQWMPSSEARRMRSFSTLLALSFGAVSVAVGGCGGSGGGGAAPDQSVHLLTSSLPGGTTGQSFSAQFDATFPHPDGASFVVTGGQLPPGLGLDPETGLLEGTPRLTGEFH